MKEIELTPKAEDLEAMWNYSFRQYGVVQADTQFKLQSPICAITFGGYDHSYSQPVSGQRPSSVLALKHRLVISESPLPLVHQADAPFLWV